jgi:patatin-related protein
VKKGTDMNPRKEIRFALVLNGGVSLAVWMGGVTHELNRLRLASDPTAQRPADPAEAAVHDAWSAILTRSCRRAVVDTVAGTSAGGINGTLIAAAIAGGKDLPDMKTTWAQVAALRPGQLLRKPPKRPRKGADPLGSLLDGRFFHQEVHKLLTGLADSPAVATPQDCTLLVTATALDASPIPIQLEGEAKASMMDSRRVFRFQRRTDDRGHVKDDFTGGRDSIALAARASASFPVAFEPVDETQELHSFQISPAGTGKNSLLIDGGVLDNAPFGPLMGVLRARPVGAPFDRVVLYVTPTPGLIDAAAASDKDRSVRRVLQRVVNATREPDQRLDFESLHHAFTRMGLSFSTPHDAITRLLRSPNPQALIDASQAALAAGNWFTTYRHARAEATERELASLSGEIRFAAPAPAELSPEKLHSVPTQLDYTGTEWRWGLATAERALRWWGRALVAYVRARGLGAEAEPVFGKIQHSQQRMVRLREQLGTYLRADLGESLQVRAERMNAFYTPEVDEEFREALESAAQAIAGMPGLSAVDARSLVDFTLAIEVASAALSWSSTTEEDTPPFQYHQITPAAEPVLSLGEVATKPDWLARKLYGQRWGHFGAFASDRGRNADWLWGRLDGASALCDHLLRDADGAQQLKRELAEAILAAEGSSEDQLRKAVAEADATSGVDLLRHMPPPERRTTAGLVWRQAVTLLGEASPSTARAQHLARAFADPTWKAKDLRGKTSLRTRVRARLVRMYGWPIRRVVRRGTRKFLDV